MDFFKYSDSANTNTKKQVHQDARQQALDAIKTRFLVPKDESSWLEYKKNERNCLILFEDKIYHINSDKTLSMLMPLDMQTALWGEKKHLSQAELAKHIQIQDAPLSKQDRTALSDDDLVFIHNAHTNMYTIGYKKDGQYVEKPLETLLEGNTPFDPSLASARKTLKAASEDYGFLKYAKATIAKLPRADKFHSIVHQGKLNFHEGYSFAEYKENTPLKKGIVYLSQDIASEGETGGQVRYSIITPTGETVLKKTLGHYTNSLNHLINDNSADSDRKNMIRQIAANGHAYGSKGLQFDPNTTAFKLSSKGGRQELRESYQKQREKQKIAYHSLSENIKDAYNTDRLEMIQVAERMAKGELTINGNVTKKVDSIQTDEVVESNDTNPSDEAVVSNDTPLKENPYSEELDRYTHDEISNQLSYVLAAREELHLRWTEAQAKNQNVDISTLNRDMLAEQYQVTDLNEQQYAALAAWMKNPQNKPPVELEKGVLYLYKDPQGNIECFGINPYGELRQTQKIDSASLEGLSEKEKLDTLLNHAEKAQVTLSACLVPPDRLAKYRYAQRCLDKMSRSHWFSSQSSLPQDKQDQLIRMMTKHVAEPDSVEAKHYLRTHHNMYLTTNKPKEPLDMKDPTSGFYLDSETNKLYRFIETNSVPVGYEAVEVEYKKGADKYINRLYKIAKEQLGDDCKTGSCVKISCKDVYYNISLPSKDGLKMNTIGEMLEEIYQAEHGEAKLYEHAGKAVVSAIGGWFALGFGAVPLVGAAVVSWIISVSALLAAAGSFLLSFVGAKSFVSTLRRGDLSDLKQTMAEIEKEESELNDFSAAVGVINDVRTSVADVTQVADKDSDEVPGETTDLEPFAP